MVNRQENSLVTDKCNLRSLKLLRFVSRSWQERMMSSQFYMSSTQPNWQTDSMESGEGSGVVVRTRDQLAPPSMYKVLLHNDDFTPMDFVVSILMAVFHMESMKANEVMLDVHQKGVGLCGIYPFDIAETKVSQVQQEAKANQFPLKCTYEAE